MKRYFILALAATMLVLGCKRNAITGRRQAKLFGEEVLQQQALTEYKSFLSQTKVAQPSQNRDAEMVTRVGSRIAAAITEYYTQKGLQAELNGYKWEFNLVEGKEVNAWCMPGGKVVVYTGLLPVTQNEAALAVVMGHEIAHAVAHHGNERISQAALAQGFEIAGNIFTSGNQKANGLFNSIFAPGAQIGVLLPNSRKQELEADKFGLFFAAMAGYNPNEAVPFWKRMGQAGGQAPPEFLATHPSDERRIAQLQAIMPEAMTYYRPINSIKQ
jgi:predicted Zn-dependent protease